MELGGECPSPSFVILSSRGLCPLAKFCHIIEPWFLGAGATGSSYLLMIYLVLVLWYMHIHKSLSTTHLMNHNTHIIIGPGGPEFAAFKDKTAAEHGVQFHTSLSAVPPVADGVKRLALISGRTVDNPKLLTESIAAGCTVIYLEKPGTFVCDNTYDNCVLLQDG